MTLSKVIFIIFNIDSKTNQSANKNDWKTKLYGLFYVQQCIVSSEGIVEWTI